MLRLSLMRHAEAAGTAAGSQDRHRALTEDGRATAHALGKFLARERQVPDLVLCSDAVRAVDTAHLVLGGAEASHPVVILEELYHADPGMVLMLIREHAAEDAQHVLVVGHNPTVGALAALLAGQGGQTAPETRAFSPGSCAQFAVQAIDWESFDPAHASLRRMLDPEDYRTD